MTFDTITRAWFDLLFLSAASVLIAAGFTETLGAGATGGLVLVFAWMKARVILSRYLGLWQAPIWLSGFNWALGLFCLLLLGLFLIPEISP
ncbi:nitric oxide reductase NorF protein [Labrenzia sp. EL_13]|nr:nitric oxide reductase NorF protein [Labrenzia sp. EL_13]